MRGAISRQLALQHIALDLGLAEPAPQRVVVHQQAVDLGAQRAEVLQVLRADGAAPDLVLVGRADAAPGGADLALAGRALAHLVELAVQRQDQRGVLGDAQVVGADLSTPCACAARLDLVAQRPGIDHHAVADDDSLPGRTTPEGSSDSL